MKSSIAALAMAALAAVTATPALAAAPDSRSGWKDFSGTMNDCSSRADAGLHEARMTLNMQNAGDDKDKSFYGENDSYAAEVRCIIGKSIVILMVTGPNGDEAVKLKNIIASHF